MKNLILTFLMLIFLVSCETEKSVKSDLDKLKSERETLMGEVTSLNGVAEQKKFEISDLETKAKELGMLAQGRTPKYILKLHLKQSHFSLSIKKHIADAVNAIDFEMPVDKEFYDSVKVGTSIVDEFRSGSFFLKGSFGDWEMTVKEKEIR